MPAADYAKTAYEPFINQLRGWTTTLSSGLLPV